MLGFNYRMTDLQAALGLSQLQRIEHYVEQRNVLARRYDAGLQSAALQLPKVLPQNRSAFHLYVVHVRQEAARKTRRQAFDELRARGVGVNVHYTPVHLQPYYRELGFARGQYPHAEAHGRRAITLPLHPGLSVQQQDQVIAAVLETVGS